MNVHMIMIVQCLHNYEELKTKVLRITDCVDISVLKNNLTKKEYVIG